MCVLKRTILYEILIRRIQFGCRLLKYILLVLYIKYEGSKFSTYAY